jgi:hypothetical protein
MRPIAAIQSASTPSSPTKRSVSRRHRSSPALRIAAGKCQALKMMVEEIRKGEQLYFIDMAALIKEVEEQNDHARTLTRKRNTMTINSLVKRTKKTEPAKPETTSTDSLAPVTDVYAALIEEATKENT